MLLALSIGEIGQRVGCCSASESTQLFRRATDGCVARIMGKPTGARLDGTRRAAALLGHAVAGLPTHSALGPLAG
jgi:hypothetical protein